MRTILTASALLALGAAPAAASALLPATNGVVFSAFDTSSQGTLLASKTVSGQAFTFAGTANLAVYRNVAGTLDFYYQFARTGAGLISNDAVEAITGANFSGFLVDAMFSNADVDGAGLFTTSNNRGAVATAERNAAGSVVGVNFAQSNPLSGREISATYIFRTDATKFSTGTFGAIDGSTLQGMGYQPAGAVPEVSTWALFLMGFGAAGHSVRRARKPRLLAIS
jgi:hypothetical protein